MVDRGLIARMVDDGWDRDAATQNVEAMVATIVAQIHAGKSVQLDGIGTLRAPTKVTRAGFPPQSLREQRKVELRHGAMISTGEPYPDPRVQPRKSSTYGR